MAESAPPSTEQLYSDPREEGFRSHDVTVMANQFSFGLQPDELAKGVPSTDEMTKVIDLGQQLLANATGEGDDRTYRDSQGNVIDSSAAEAVIAMGKVQNWGVSKEEGRRLQGLAGLSVQPKGSKLFDAALKIYPDLALTVKRMARDAQKQDASLTNEQAREQALRALGEKAKTRAAYAVLAGEHNKGGTATLDDEGKLTPQAAPAERPRGGTTRTKNEPPRKDERYRGDIKQRQRRARASDSPEPAPTSKSSSKPEELSTSSTAETASRSTPDSNGSVTPNEYGVGQAGADIRATRDALVAALAVPKEDADLSALRQALGKAFDVRMAGLGLKPGDAEYENQRAQYLEGLRGSVVHKGGKADSIPDDLLPKEGTLEPQPAGESLPGAKPVADGSRTPKPSESDNSKTAGKPAPANEKKPTQQTLEAAETAYLTHLKENRHKFYDNEDLENTQYDLADALKAAYVADAKARGVDTDSDEFEEEFDKYWNEEFEPKIDAVIDEQDTNLDGGSDEGATSSQEAPRGRVKRALNSAKMELVALRLAVTRKGGLKEYFKDPERGRKRIIGGVLGVVAVGAGAYFTLRGIGVFDSHDTAQHAIGSGPHNDELPTAPKPPVQHHNLVPKPETATLSYKGDTIWHEVAERNPNLHGHALWEEVDKTLKANHMSWEDARHMQVGQHFNLPTHGAASVAHQAAESTQHAAAANTETLGHYNSHTGAGTLSGATLEHLHHLNVEVPTGAGQLEALTSQVAEYNHLKPEELTQLPVGYVVHFPPEVILQQWIDHLKGIDDARDAVKSSLTTRVAS